MTTRVDGAGIFNPPPACARGDDVSFEITVINLDWTADTIAAQLRTSPDAQGSALASFTVTKTLVSGNTIITLSLSRAVTGAASFAPSKVVGEDVTLFIDVTRLSGGALKTIAAGKFILVGKVTQ